MSRRVTLMVFGREDARDEWLKAQVQDGQFVRLTSGTVVSDDGAILTAVVREVRDYHKLMGMELADVTYDSTFLPPHGWWGFIACRIRSVSADNQGRAA